MLCLLTFQFHLIYGTTNMIIHKFSLGSQKIRIIFHESIIPLMTKGTIILCTTKKEKEYYSLNYDMQLPVKYKQF